MIFCCLLLTTSKLGFGWATCNLYSQRRCSDPIWFWSILVFCDCSSMFRHWVTYWGGHPCSWFHWLFHSCLSSGRTSGKRTASSSVYPLGDDCSCAHAYPAAPQSDRGGPQWPWAWTQTQFQKCSVEFWQLVSLHASVFLCGADGRPPQVRRRRKPLGPAGETKTGRKAVLMTLVWSWSRNKPQIQPWSRTRQRQPYSLQQPIWSW